MRPGVADRRPLRRMEHQVDAHEVVERIVAEGPLEIRELFREGSAEALEPGMGVDVEATLGRERAIAPHESFEGPLVPRPG